MNAERAARPPRSSLALCLIIGSGGALALAMACGSDSTESDPPAAAASDSSGGSGVAAAGAANSSGAGNGGAGNVAAAGEGGSTNAAGEGPGGAAGSDDGPPPDEEFTSPLDSCTSDTAAGACGWTLSAQFTGTPCTPGERLIVGCCDCGDDSVMRVCDGNASCSGDDELNFSDDACQSCPVTSFTCPTSGVFSVVTGTYPSGATDAQGNFVGFDEEGNEIPLPPSQCQPTLISDLGGVDGDAGVINFESVQPVLVSNCGRCHASDSGLGELLGLPPFADTDTEVAFEAASILVDVILGQISAGVMPPDSCDGPPGSTGCVSTEDFALLTKWYAAGAPL